jgi:hypothetical protein
MAQLKNLFHPLQQGLEPEYNLGQLPKIQEIEVGEGLGGNVQTIKFMKETARVRANDPLIRKLALNILLDYQVASNYYIDESLAIGDFVKKKVRYVRDPIDVEYLQDPVDLVKQIPNGTAQGDCDDMALLTAALLLSIGHNPCFRAVRYNQNGGPFNHIYVVDYEKNPNTQQTRIVLDCIIKDQPIGTEVNHQSGAEFPVAE